MSNAVTVRVPATSANLGSGFDAVGLAVTLFASITVTPDEPGRRRPPDPIRRMVTSAVRAAFRRAERSAPHTIEVDSESKIPLGRGLGASAAARGAGIVAANALMGSPLSDNDMLEVGTELEGHADNVAPALFGGLQVTALDGSRVTRVDVPLPAGLKCVAFVPELSMPTHETRNLLPKRLARDDAVFNSSRAALLVAALSTGRWDALNVAMEERLHQRPRSALFPQMFDLFRAAGEAGAHGAYLSGGGSTVMAFSDLAQADTVRAALESAALRLEVPGSSYLLDPCSTGAEVVDGAVG
jgi:homoserine kinase